MSQDGAMRGDLATNHLQAYVLLAGQKHPMLMGQSYAEAWVEIWDDVKDVFANARLTGQATMKVMQTLLSPPKLSITFRRTTIVCL